MRVSACVCGTCTLVFVLGVCCQVRFMYLKRVRTAVTERKTKRLDFLKTTSKKRAAQLEAQHKREKKRKMEDVLVCSPRLIHRLSLYV